MNELNLVELIKKKNKDIKRSYSLIALPFKFIFGFFLVISLIIFIFIFNISNDISKKIILVIVLGTFMLFLLMINVIISLVIKNKTQKKLLTGEVSVRVYKGTIVAMKSEKTYSYVPDTRRRVIERILVVEFENSKEDVSIPLCLYTGLKNGDEIYMIVFNNEKAFAPVFPCNNYYLSDEMVLRETIYLNIDN